MISTTSINTTMTNLNIDCFSNLESKLMELEKTSVHKIKFLNKYFKNKDFQNTLNSINNDCLEDENKICQFTFLLYILTLNKEYNLDEKTINCLLTNFYKIKSISSYIKNKDYILDYLNLGLLRG